MLSSNNNSYDEKRKGYWLRLCKLHHPSDNILAVDGLGLIPGGLHWFLRGCIPGQGYWLCGATVCIAPLVRPWGLVCLQVDLGNSEGDQGSCPRISSSWGFILSTIRLGPLPQLGGGWKLGSHQTVICSQILLPGFFLRDGGSETGGPMVIFDKGKSLDIQVDEWGFGRFNPNRGPEHRETYSPFTSFFKVVGPVMAGCWQEMEWFQMGVYLAFFFVCSSFSASALSFSASSSNLLLVLCSSDVVFGCVSCYLCIPLLAVNVRLFVPDCS